jgi:hypothetical protein
MLYRGPAEAQDFFALGTKIYHVVRQSLARFFQHFVYWSLAMRTNGFFFAFFEFHTLLLKMRILFPLGLLVYSQMFRELFGNST